MGVPDQPLGVFVINQHTVSNIFGSLRHGPRVSEFPSQHASRALKVCRIFKDWGFLNPDRLTDPVIKPKEDQVPQAVISRLNNLGQRYYGIIKPLSLQLPVPQ